VVSTTQEWEWENAINRGGDSRKRSEEEVAGGEDRRRR